MQFSVAMIKHTAGFFAEHEANIPTIKKQPSATRVVQISLVTHLKTDITFSFD